MYETPRTTATRVYSDTTWSVIMDADDSKKMQRIRARGIDGEMFTDVERPQVYGFTSVPVKPDENGAKAAEVAVAFRAGNRAHPYVMSEGDRRSRPTDLKPGESKLRGEPAHPQADRGGVRLGQGVRASAPHPQAGPRARRHGLRLLGRGLQPRPPAKAAQRTGEGVRRWARHRSADTTAPVPDCNQRHRGDRTVRFPRFPLSNRQRRRRMSSMG